MLRAKFKMVNEVQESIVEIQYILSVSIKNDYENKYLYFAFLYYFKISIQSGGWR